MQRAPELGFPGIPPNAPVSWAEGCVCDPPAVCSALVPALVCRTDPVAAEQVVSAWMSRHLMWFEVVSEQSIHSGDGMGGVGDLGGRG